MNSGHKYLQKPQRKFTEQSPSQRVLCGGLQNDNVTMMTRSPIKPCRGE